MDNQDQDQVAQPQPQLLGRRALLGVAGAGAWAGATLGGLGSGEPTASAQPIRAADRTPYPDDLPLLSGEEFPIGVFWPPPPYETTEARYQEIAEAGFNFIITGNYLNDQYILDWVMRRADATGLKVIEAQDPHIGVLLHWLTITDTGSGPLEFTPDEARTWLREAYDLYKGHPSYAGINLYDEPTPAESQNVARAYPLYREIAPDRLPYVNLARGISANPTRLAQFIELVDPPLISFDHYPLFTDSIDQTYFADWASVRQAGLTYGLPTWIYINTVQHLNYRSPTTAEMLWEINVSLAYGCKGIQYFTYWTPEGARGIGFADGPGALIGLDGKRTERYDGAKSINNDWLSRVGKQLKPLTSESIGIANLLDYPPAGLPAFAPNDYIKETWGDPFIISRFSSSDDDDHRWFLAVNYALDADATGRINFGSRVAQVERFKPSDEAYQKVKKQADIALEPGAAVLYRVSVA